MSGTISGAMSWAMSGDMSGAMSGYMNAATGVGPSNHMTLNLTLI